MYVSPVACGSRVCWSVWWYARTPRDRGVRAGYTFAGLVLGGTTSGQALDTLAWLGTNKRP